MPVMAKFSQHFYERLGEQIANELVDWFNLVDQSYGSDLRELNELNFARFDAKLEQRIAEVLARTDQRIAEVLARTDQRFAEVNARITELDSRLSAKIAELDAGIERRFNQNNRWLIATFITVVLGVGGLGVGVAGLWLRH